jgi:hypothetical protein
MIRSSHRLAYGFVRSIVAAHRDAAFAKTLTATAVLLGLLAIAVLTARDQPQQYMADMVEPHALHPSGEFDPQLRLLLARSAITAPTSMAELETR